MNAVIFSNNYPVTISSYPFIFDAASCCITPRRKSSDVSKLLRFSFPAGYVCRMYYSIIILALSVVLSVSANVWNTYNVTFSTNATLTYFFEQKTADFSANNTYDVVLSATPASPEDFCSLLRDATPNSLGRLVLIKAVCCHYTTQPVPVRVFLLAFYCLNCTWCIR